MKIRPDKVESHPPHSLRPRDVRLILATVPPDWIAELKEVRLANSLEYCSPYAYFSRYDGCLTVYSRAGTKKEAVIAVLSALASESLGINRGIRRHRAEAEKHRIDQLIQPLLEKLLPEMTQSKKLSPVV